MRDMNESEGLIGSGVASIDRGRLINYGRHERTNNDVTSRVLLINYSFSWN
jgi:hypothetical protein